MCLAPVQINFIWSVGNGRVCWLLLFSKLHSKFWLKHWGKKASKGLLAMKFPFPKLFFFPILVNWSNKSNFFLLQALLHSLLIYWFVPVDGLGKAGTSCYFGKKKCCPCSLREYSLNKTRWWALVLITSCPKSLIETTYKVAKLYNIGKKIKHQ